MQRVVRRLCLGLLLVAATAHSSFAQGAPLTWQQVRDKFEAANPTLRAGQIGVDESRAQENHGILAAKSERIRAGRPDQPIRRRTSTQHVRCAVVVGHRQLPPRAPAQARTAP